MDWGVLAKWLLGPTGLLAAVATWLFRRRHGSGSWIGRRLNAEKDLVSCQQEMRDQQASFDRQEATLLREIAGRDREIATRDREIAYLMAATERLSRSAEQVIETHDAGLLQISAPSPNAPSPSPTPSPTSPAKPPPSTVR